jgi:hypothetical protein
MASQKVCYCTVRVIIDSKSTYLYVDQEISKYGVGTTCYRLLSTDKLKDMAKAMMET